MQITSYGVRNAIILDNAVEDSILSNKFFVFEFFSSENLTGLDVSLTLIN